MKIKKGDLVQVIAGKDRGRQIKVERVEQKEKRVFLVGINQYKKHRKSQSGGQSGEIITLSRSMGIASVALVCPKCKQITRIGYKITKDSKVRCCRKCGMEI